MAYFTNVGPKKGPFLWRDARGAAIGVLEAPDNHAPIGMATPFGWVESGAARWKLTVHGVAVPRALARDRSQVRPRRVTR